MQTQPSPIHNAANETIEQYQDRALNMAYNIASIFTMPVEVFIRPHFGSQYFFVLNVFLSTILLSMFAAFTTAAEGIGQMIPFAHFRPPAGMFGLGSFLAFFFLANVVHGFRLWRRMIFMELEDISTNEGSPLSFFAFLPRGNSHWVCRTFYEPAFVWLVSGFLSMFLIIQTPLLVFLHVAAICLAMKSYVAWYKNWAYVRNLMDVANAAPIVSRILSNTATEDDKARVHLASLPDNLPPEIHKATMDRVARAFSLSTEADHA